MQLVTGVTARTVNAWLIAAFYTITAGSAFVAHAIGVPDQLLLVLLPPVLLAALRRQRYVYVAMLLFYFACAIIVTENYRLPITDSTLTVFSIFLMAVLACEAIRWVAQRQARLSQRLIESERRLRAFLDNAPDSIFVLDGRGRIADVNDAACQAFGYAREALLGNPFGDFFVDECPIAAHQGRIPQWTGQLRRSDGSIINVEMSVEDFTFQRETSCVAIVRDIEERVQAEAQLRQSEAIRQSILESTPDHVMMIDLDYRIQFINRTVPDLTVESVLNRVVLELVPPESVDGMVEVYENVRKTRLPGKFETEYVSTTDGSVSYFESRIAPVIENDEVAGYIVSASDVTDRRQQEAEQLEIERSLLRSQKLESLGLLAGGIAHDFNNLLVAILGRADLAREDADSPNNVRDHLQQITEASQHAASLCQQLLAYSGKGKFFVAPTDWPALIVDSRSLLEISTPDHARVAYDLDDDPATIEADATQMKQVIMNLFTNAAEALPLDGGEIVVRTGTMDLDHAGLQHHFRGEELREGLYAYLEVEDTGSGMSPETMERLFDPFYTTKPEGTGLGMAAVLGIVRSHGGAMSVQSNNDQGTTIRIVIPAQATLVRETGGQERIGASPGTGSGLILVVDDEPFVREIARKMLERAEFDVVCADSGAMAVDLLEQRPNEIDAVLLDMKMPGMNGEQAMEKLRAIRPDLPILLSTGYSESEISERLEGKGVSAFLPKPYHATDLIDAINGVLSTGRV